MMRSALLGRWDAGSPSPVTIVIVITPCNRTRGFVTSPNIFDFSRKMLVSNLFAPLSFAPGRLPAVRSSSTVQQPMMTEAAQTGMLETLQAAITRVCNCMNFSH